GETGLGPVGVERDRAAVDHRVASAPLVPQPPEDVPAALLRVGRLLRPGAELAPGDLLRLPHPRVRARSGSDVEHVVGGDHDASPPVAGRSSRIIRSVRPSGRVATNRERGPPGSSPWRSTVTVSPGSFRPTVVSISTRSA